MPRFTSANARENAARSIAVRKAAREKRNALRFQAEPQTRYSGALSDSEPAAGLGIDVACVRARLQTLDQMMAKAKSDKEWDNLSRSFERLFKIICVLTNTPSPGSYKPAPPRPRPQPPLLLTPRPVRLKPARIEARRPTPATIPAEPVPPDSEQQEIPCEPFEPPAVTAAPLRANPLPRLQGTVGCSPLILREPPPPLGVIPKMLVFGPNGVPRYQ